MKSRGI
jgi:hypothetical protein